MPDLSPTAEALLVGVLRLARAGRSSETRMVAAALQNALEVAGLVVEGDPAPGARSRPMTHAERQAAYVARKRAREGDAGRHSPSPPDTPDADESDESDDADVTTRGGGKGEVSSLSERFSDLREREEGSDARQRHAVTASPASRPSLANLRVTLDMPIPAEFVETAKGAGGGRPVKDVESAWAKFKAKMVAAQHEGKTPHVQGEWQSYCVSWALNESKAPPASGSQPQEDPEDRRRRERREAQERDAEVERRAHAARQREGGGLAPLGGSR